MEIWTLYQRKRQLTTDKNNKPHKFDLINSKKEKITTNHHHEGFD
jgi:hypothetical protein